MKVWISDFSLHVLDALHGDISSSSPRTVPNGCSATDEITRISWPNAAAPRLSSLLFIPGVTA
jgi:hypothetical protein